MVTFEEIKAVRLSINDPIGFIDILSVANMAALPAAPAPQTVYYLEDSYKYVSTEKESGATSADYSVVELQLSDSMITALITNIGVDKAPCRSFELISRKLGGQLRIVKTTNGAESDEFTRLAELYNYYKSLSDDCKKQYKEDNNLNSGIFGTSLQPAIGGGNL